MATGDLIGIINSDDYYEKEAVAIMVREYGKVMANDNSQKYVILYGMTRILDNDMEKSVSLSRHEYLREAMISHPSSFVSKALYESFGGYDTEFVSAADYDFMLRMSENKKVAFFPVYEVIANFSLGGMCSSSKAYYDLLKVQRKHEIISESLYKKTMLKCKIYDLIKGTK